MAIPLLLLLIAIPFIASAQDYEVTVTEVMVWVKATDKSGKALTGLSQSDFEIYEDNQKVSPSCFEEFALNAAATASTQTQTTPSASDGAPSSAMKRIVIIIDLYNTQQAEFLNIKPKIVEFIRQLPSHWQIMLGTILPGGVEIGVPFTSNTAELEAKVEHIAANSRRDIEILNRRREISLLLRSRITPVLVEEAYRLAQLYATEEMRMSRESLKALEKLEQEIVRWKDDNHLVMLYISGGIISEPGRQYFDLVESKTRGSSVASNSIFAIRERGSELRGLLRKMIAQLNRHNITFYTINTRGAISALPDDTIEDRKNRRAEDATFLDDAQELMSDIADQTGGIYFENSTNFRKGFDLILGDLDHQYVICYKPPAHKKRGEYHKIKVVTNKPGVQLRHRALYLD